MLPHNFTISFAFDNGNTSLGKWFKINFRYPYDEILSHAFNSAGVSLRTLERVDKLLDEIEQQKSGEITRPLCIQGDDEDAYVVIYKDKSRLIDPGPDEDHSHPPYEIYLPNWNKRNPDKEWVDTEMIVALIKEWRSFLIHAENLILVDKQHVKDDYLKSLDA